MITIEDLRKTYDNGVEALKGITLDVKDGEFYGLLGPNGAGKSTTIGIISSLVTKTSGKLVVNGYDIDSHHKEAKESLGIVPQEFNFNIFEPCEQILVNQAGYYGVPRAEAMKRSDELLSRLGLWEKRHGSAKALSGGMKRRLMIARGLVHKPKILILDEPTAGVDIQLRRNMYEFLREENEKGLTIILTTHYLEEAESLCERIGIIDKGLLIENAPTNEIVEKLTLESFIVNCSSLPETVQVPAYEIKKLSGNSLEVVLEKEQSITDFVQGLSAQNISVDRIRNKANRLEEIFLRLVTDNGA